MRDGGHISLDTHSLYLPIGHNDKIVRYTILICCCKSTVEKGTNKKSVMSGGEIKGWTPDVAAILWRRMLSALGDVNKLENPVLHERVFQYLLDLNATMTRVIYLYTSSSTYILKQFPSCARKLIFHYNFSYRFIKTKGL